MLSRSGDKSRGGLGRGQFGATYGSSKLNPVVNDLGMGDLVVPS